MICEMRMKTKKFVVLCLCMVLIFTTVFSNTTLTAKAGSVSAGESMLLTESDSVSSGDVNFYDADGKTLLLSVPIQYDESGIKLKKFHSNYNDLNLTRNGYSIRNWYCSTDGNTYLPKEVYSSLLIKGDMDFVACWETTPQTFTIKYYPKGGEFKKSAPTEFTVKSGDITLPKLVKEGYVFHGWYQESSYQNPIKKIPAGTYINSDSNGKIAVYKVYAKWTSAKPAQMSRPVVTNNVKGKVMVKFAALEDVNGYELVYATDSKFSQNVKTKNLGSKTTFSLSNVGYGVKFYFKVRAYTVDSAGKKVYGSYSPIGSFKVTNGSVKPVKKLTVKNSGKGKITISYKKVDNVSGYEALYSTDKNFKKNKKVVDLKTKATFYIKNAYYGETYYIKVRAYGLNAKGKKIYGSYSPVSSCTVKKGAVKQVAKVTAKNNAKGKVKISFKEIVGVDGYELVYSTDKNFKKIFTKTKDLKKKNGFTMTGLFYGDSYYIKVRAYGLDSKGNKVYGKYSSVTSCSVKNGNVKQVSKPTVQNNANGKINVSITAMDKVSGYELIYSTTKNFKKNVKTKDLKKKTGFTVKNALHGQIYYFKVRAYGMNASGKKIYGKYSAISSCKVENGYIAQAAKPKAKNSKVGEITVSFTKLNSKVSGYELLYSSDKNFKKNTFTKDLGTKTSCTLTNLLNNKTYYFKVRAYAMNTEKTKVYGKFSNAVSCKVTKGVQEYNLSGNMGTLTNVSIKDKTDLYVAATVSKRIKSSDEYYYLVKVDPDNGRILDQIATAEKVTNVVFRLPVRDDEGNNHIQGKYGVAIKSGSNYVLITTATAYIDNPQDAASYTAAFPTPKSKKGRQGLYDTNMGDKNAFVNFNMNEIFGSESSHAVAYKYNGKTYYFYYPKFGDVTKVNQDGGTVTVQVMLQWASHCTDLILPSGRTPGAHYYAFNTKEKEAREKIEAAFHFITEWASQENYHVDNWILGNEVNTYKNMNAKWYYAGDIPRDQFMENYASTFRMLYYAAKSNNRNARVYICSDHTWIDRDNDWGSKYFMASFNQRIKGQNSNIQWNLAYHAYSAVLTNADFWNDGSLAPNSDNADFVSPNNLDILTNYVKNTFGPQVRIILSEQGFSSSGGVGSPYNEGRQTGEAVQAAAMTWLYYKAQFNDMIDAVIFSSGDHGGAGYQFGVEGKMAESAYKYMDTPSYATYTNQYLPVISKSSWQEAVSGFDGNVLSKMPGR